MPQLYVIIKIYASRTYHFYFLFHYSVSIHSKVFFTLATSPDSFLSQSFAELSLLSMHGAWYIPHAPAAKTPYPQSQV